MIYVVATVQVKAGQRSAFLDEFHRVVPLVRQESGCLEYGPTVDVATEIPAQAAPREDTVVVLEKWESLPALLAHLQAPHMMEYRQRVKGLVESVGLQVLKPADSARGMDG